MGSMEQEKFVFIKKWSFYSFSVKPNPFFLQINWLMLKKNSASCTSTIVFKWLLWIKMLLFQ